MDKERWLEQYYPKMIRVGTNGLKERVEEEFRNRHVVNLISNRQEEELYQLVPKTLGFIQIILGEEKIGEIPVTLIELMTFGQAEALIQGLKMFCSVCDTLIEEDNSEFRFKYEELLTQEFLEIIYQIGMIFPLNAKGEELVPLTPFNTVISRQEIERMKKFFNNVIRYMSVSYFSKLDIKFDSILRKQYFIARLYSYLKTDYKYRGHLIKDYKKIREIINPLLNIDDSLIKSKNESIKNDLHNLKKLESYAIFLMDSF